MMRYLHAEEQIKEKMKRSEMAVDSIIWKLERTSSELVVRELYQIIYVTRAN
jgi:hypothetical protein